MNFSFAEYRTVVSIVKTQNKLRWSATRLNNGNVHQVEARNETPSNQNFSPCLANFQYTTKFHLPDLLVGVTYLLIYLFIYLFLSTPRFLKNEIILKFKHTGHILVIFI
jgi:hypothetical protein